MKNTLYDFDLPQELIAREPASPRDQSRLMVYHTATDHISLDRFSRIARYLPENSFLVLNQTEVVPARVVLNRENGGHVTVLFLMNEPSVQGLIRGMVDRKIIVGESVFIDAKHSFDVVAQDANIFAFRPRFSAVELTELLHHHGVMPIPPYLKDSTLTEQERRKKYQTTFCHPDRNSFSSRAEGLLLASIAAPTASLHFTHRVFKSLDRRNIPHFFVTLHVGMGTFAPVTASQIESQKLHSEWYSVDAKTVEGIRQFKAAGRKLVAVGTTTVRTLESGWTSSLSSGATDLFIMPPFDFKAVDMLMTNFHLPGSSLMMLVEAFLQHKKAKRHLREIYRLAIKNRFRFYSFGDAMLIL